METKSKNIFSSITLWWMLTVIILFIVLAFLGLFMRTEQANLLPGLQEYFYSAMTLHGIGMAGIWYVGSMAGVIYVSAKYISPSKKVQNFSYITSVLGIVVILISVVIGKFAAGWYFLYPLPFKGTWPMWSTVAFLLGITILGVSWLVWNFDYLRAVSEKYKLHHALGWQYISGKEEPVTPPFITITTTSVIACFAALISAVILIIFYFTEIGTEKMNDALLMKNLTFFFGHLIVNLSMYLGVGIVYDVFPEYTGRYWKNNRAVSIAWNFVLLLVLFAYFHHLYMDFAQPVWMQYAGQIASYTSSIPAAIMSIFGTLAIVYKSNIKWNLSSSFMFLGIMGWAIGGIGAVIDSTVAVNTVFHNTLWVPAHFHTYMIAGLVMIIMGYFFHVVLEISESNRNERTSQIILGLYLIGGYGFVMAFYMAGADSIPRRYSSYGWDVISKGPFWAEMGLFFGLLLFLAILLYFIVFFNKWKKAYHTLQ
ncbi:MAG: Cytochrome c oxidase (B(O/a)3-type) chain I [Cytophagales bacterium]|jgi:cytochrome c oxidase subunit 1|nr:cbb3-type cytochrome c oxidase subunit I [Bacteroidota bacterium]MBS1981657.1 cbb3-type cytochrome c oxidase subunit I [Bacteroidota bacterium]WHZ08967.1 MAG: Cytochrome c oxidase (B(O/a)3-type) chain I [Cytophagales bacterium]